MQMMELWFTITLWASDMGTAAQGNAMGIVVKWKAADDHQHFS